MLSAVVSLTLVPMMCALMMRLAAEQSRSRFGARPSAASIAIIAEYDRGLDWVLDHQALMLVVAS